MLKLSGFGVSPESIGIHRAEPGASRATQAASPKGSDRGSEQIKGPINRRVELYREPAWASSSSIRSSLRKRSWARRSQSRGMSDSSSKSKTVAAGGDYPGPEQLGLVLVIPHTTPIRGETFPNLLVNKLGLLVDDLTGKTIDRHVDPVMFFPLDREFFEISFAGCVFSVLSNDIN